MLLRHVYVIWRHSHLFLLHSEVTSDWRAMVLEMLQVRSWMNRLCIQACKHLLYSQLKVLLQLEWEKSLEKQVQWTQCDAQILSCCGANLTLPISLATHSLILSKMAVVPYDNEREVNILRDFKGRLRVSSQRNAPIFLLSLCRMWRECRP